VRAFEASRGGEGIIDAPPKIAVIGCGNPSRTDDGAGVEVVRRLRAGGLASEPDVELFDAGNDGAALLFAVRGCKTLIVIDACESGAEPGAVFEVPADVLEAPRRAGPGPRDFRWDDALHATSLLTLPGDVRGMMAVVVRQGR